MKAGELLLASDLVRAGVWGLFLAAGDLDLDRPWLGAVTAVATAAEVTEAAADRSQSTRRSAAASSRGCR